MLCLPRLHPSLWRMRLVQASSEACTEACTPALDYYKYLMHMLHVSWYLANCFPLPLPGRQLAAGSPCVDLFPASAAGHPTTRRHGAQQDCLWEIQQIHGASSSRDTTSFLRPRVACRSFLSDVSAWLLLGISNWAAACAGGGASRQRWSVAKKKQGERRGNFRPGSGCENLDQCIGTRVSLAAGPGRQMGIKLGTILDVIHSDRWHFIVICNIVPSITFVHNLLYSNIDKIRICICQGMLQILSNFPWLCPWKSNSTLLLTNHQ